MTKFAIFRQDRRVTPLVCSSIAFLLTACGGGDADEVHPASRPAQTAGFIASSEAVPQRTPGGQVQDTSPAPAQAAGGSVPSPVPPSAHDFALRGYAENPLQPDGGRAPAGPAGSEAGDALALYVSPSGSDSNPGSASAPFLTLARAARATRAGSIVYVAPGTYAGGLKTTIHGSASARISYVSTTRWGARIRPSGKARAAWDNRGNYVDIIGFHIDGTGSAWTGGIYNGGSYDAIRGNWIHDIARGVGCTSAGGSAIGVDSYYKGVAGDVVGNLVHDIGPAGCRYVQGIYMSTTGTVKNNVVYRVAEGGIHLWHDARNVIITNNTVTSSHTGIIIGGGNYYHTKGPSDHNRVYNNIVFDNAMGISEQGKTGKNNQYRNNLVYQNSTYDWRLLNGLDHSGTVTSHPLFMGYSRDGEPDLRLSASSPAIGRGTQADAPEADFSGRPRNPGVDIGAYQY